VPTYRLETFGKLALSGGATGTLSHQRRRLALLALLAAAGERGLSRDALLGYLWPDSTAENGRHSLEQLLHALRRSLGDSVFSGVNPVRLDPAVIASDVNDFERALARGALAEAVALHKGPFLEGFYLNDAPEFERWTSTERARLANRYAEALSRLADDAERAGDHAAAVGWRRRIADVDPVSSRSALALMRALVAAGDKTSALQHARIYETLVQQELGSAPDPSIARYAAELRAAVDPRPAGSGSAASKSIPRKETVHVEPVASAPVRAKEQVPQPVTTMARELTPARIPGVTVDATKAPRRIYWVPAAIVLGVALLLVSVFAKRNSTTTPALDANKIVIVPFRTSGVDSSLKYLGEGVVDLIAPMLTGEGGLIGVDSRTAISTWNRVTRNHDGTAEAARQVARELGAGLVLSGSVIETGRRLTLTGNVISGQTGETRPKASVSASVDSVDGLVDAFVRQLLTRQSGVAEASVSAVTSQSLPAIRAYLDGRAAYRRADEDRAVEDFSRALDIDSTFALAALDLAVATGKPLRIQFCRERACRVYSIVPGFASSDRMDDLFDRAVRLAWEYRAKLGRRDRPLLDALRGGNYPRPSSARETLSGLNRAVGAAPDRPEAHYLLGIMLLYQGPPLGMSDSRARADAAFRQASKLDSSYLAPLEGLVDVAAFDGDSAKVRRAGNAYLSRDKGGQAADYVRWLVAVATRDSSAQRAIRSRFRSFNSATLDHIYLTSQMTGLALDDADSAVTIIGENATDPIEKSVALRRSNLLALNRGRPSEATRLLRRMDKLRTDNNSFLQFTILAALFQEGDRAVADSSEHRLAEEVARDTLRPVSREELNRTSTAVATEAMWYLYNGETVRAAKAADWLQRHHEGQTQMTPNRIMSVASQMLITSRARRAEGILLRARVDSNSLAGCCELPAFANIMLAQAYEASGDDARALDVTRRGVWFHAPRFLSTYLREEGRLAARLGDRAGAIRAYEHYLALRSEPEPVLRPERDRIRAELTRLKRGR
jgi:DNA-binding SARP family transcriptional activator/TolB-like protein